MLESTPRGPARAPWRTAATNNWPLIQASGQEEGLVQLVGYSSGIMVTFNPNGQTIPANSYQLNIYAKGQNFSFLAATLVLASGAPQVLRAHYPCQCWDVRVLLLANIATPAWKGLPPVVNAIAHGRE